MWAHCLLYSYFVYINGTMAVILNPLVKWAQNRELLFLTVEISNGVVKEMQIGEDDLLFEGNGNGAHGENIYKLDITFNALIDPKGSSHKVSDRCIAINLKKKQAKYWDKLLADDKKPAWLKIDFDRWRGEDDSEDEMQDEITKVSVEHRRKQIENDLEEKVKEAEQEGTVKELLMKGYLLIYNVTQSLAFFYITFAIITKLIFYGEDAIPAVFDNVSDLLASCQIVAFIEPINAWLKFVHTGVFAPLAQCTGRFIVLFLVVTPNNELQKNIVVVILFLAWSLIENVRYPFYAAQTVGYCPKWLLWLRYTAWIPLYPLGIISEAILIFKGANLFDSSGRWTISLSFLGQLSIPFSLFLRIYLVVQVLGGCYLFRHMWLLRQKKYLRVPRRKPKTKNE